MQKTDILIIGGPRKYKETGPLKKAGFDFQVVEYNDTGSGKFFRLFMGMRRSYRRYNPDIIFSDMLNISGLFVLFFARITGTKLFLRIRGEKFSQEKTTLKLLFNLRLYKSYLYRLITFILSGFVIKRADALIPDSTFGKNGMLANTSIPDDKIRIVPIPVRFTDISLNSEEKDEIRKTMGVAGYRHVVLAVTGFNYSEKMQGLMDIIPELADYLNNREDTVFLIAGKGVLLPYFKTFLEKYPSRHIRSLGFVDDVKPLYGVSDLFLHFSYQDGCPNIILEAMLAAKPVIVNNFISFIERVEDGQDGFIVDPHKPGMLSDKLEMLLNDPVLRVTIGGNGRNRVQKNHNELVIGKQLQMTLSELASDEVG